MKLFLAAASGFFLTLTIFAFGSLTAIHFFMVDSQKRLDTSGEVAALWSAVPPAADVYEGTWQASLDRFDAREAESQPAVAALSTENDAAREDTDDLVQTASLASPDGNDLMEAHVAWCSRKYRSYDADTDSYRPYSGGTEACISPYSGGAAARPEATTVAMNDTTTSGYSEPGYSEAHIRDCMNRYRSYRVSDNSYQPYGNVPRQQCQ